MKELAAIYPIDYLSIGHVVQDLTPNGPVLGGTASYASLTARVLGMRVGIVTACAPELETPEFDGIPVAFSPSDYTTTFENIYTATGRNQFIHHVAPLLQLNMVPETWRRTSIVHLGPIAREVDPNLVRAFPDSLVCLTLQGWLRDWDNQGRVHFSEWLEASYVLEHANIAVLSIEDVRGNEKYIEEMVASIRILVVTEGPNGARVYWNGDVRHFPAPKMDEIDATGAGDIFAAAFFVRYNMTRDPWEAARFANQIASHSVTRRGLQGIPLPEEVQAAMIEVF